MKEFEKKLRRKLKILSDVIWDGKGRKSSIDNWLNNFNEEEFKVNILYLLTHFVYFNKIQVNEMLKSLYRDLYRYPIIVKARLENNNTLDPEIIENSFSKQLNKTRFVSLGSAGESSSHLLYPFGKINSIHKDYFISHNEIISTLEQDGNVNNFIFLDDLAGSGTQASEYLNELLTTIKENHPSVEFSYMVLICTTNALTNLEALGIFKEIKSVYLLDDSFKVFNENSRFYANEDNSKCINFETTKTFAAQYGKPLFEQIWKMEGLSDDRANSLSDRDKLGFKRSQLLVGFDHNTPSNTLPIIWFNEDVLPWNPIFPRFNKVYKKPI